MNRRDFLFFRTTPRGRTLELSCRSLYMRYLDSQLLARMASDGSQSDQEPWVGEPAAVLEHGTIDVLINKVENDLRDVDVLRVIDGEWLEPSGLKERIEPLLESFRARGGRVEFAREPENV